MTRPIPIAFVLPDLGGGGAQKVMLTIAGGLDRGRFAPHILVVGGSDAFAGHVPAGVPIENGGAKRLKEGLPWLVRRIRALEPAACVSVMGYLNLMLLGARQLLPRTTRLVIREANTIQSTADALPKWLPGRALYRTLYPSAHAIVSPSGTIASEIAALAPRAAALLAVIPNPVDVAGLRGRATPPKREPGQGLRLVAAGRLTRQKGYDRLLDLVPKLPGGTRLTIFGEGEDRMSLQAQASALGVSDCVRFAGFSLDVPAWIAGADALLLPSRWEGLPNVVLESLALGTPVIASDEAAAGEIAAAAPPGAVTVRPVDGAFTAAIAGCEPSATFMQEPRVSLLPAAYEQHTVIARWAQVLEKVVMSSSVPHG